MATANQSPVLNLTVFWADLNKAFNISDLLFHKGIREPGESTFSFLQALFTYRPPSCGKVIFSVMYVCRQGVPCDHYP